MITHKIRKYADLVFQGFFVGFFQSFTGDILGHTGKVLSDPRNQAAFYITLNCVKAEIFFYMQRDFEDARKFLKHPSFYQKNVKMLS